jgi:hypothetical protein
MNNDIVIAIENLARAVEAEDDEIRLWAMATVASRLGMTAVLTTEEDAVASLVEVGEMWCDTVAQQLEDDPGRRGETLRAAHAVVMRLLEGVECSVLAA